jgi:hypothetical protein
MSRDGARASRRCTRCRCSFPPERRDGDTIDAGVAGADSRLIAAAIEYPQWLSGPYLFNHAMRSWLFAEAIGRVNGVGYDSEGGDRHDPPRQRPHCRRDGPFRFEVNGADAPLSFIKGRGLSDRRAQLIWDLVAPNSMPSLVLHKEPEVAVGTRGVSAPEDEAAVCRDLLPAGHGAAGDEPRQLPSRFRRAVRAGLQSGVNGRPADERAVRRMNGSRFAICSPHEELNDR